MRSMTASAPKVAIWTQLLFLLVSLSVSTSFGPAQTRGATPAGTVEEGVVKLADANIEYFSQGNGAPIVLLPFGSLTVGYLEGLSQDLADAGYRVVRINFRGSGRSTGSGEGVTLHTLAADVAGVIQTLKLGPVNVAGHAFGNRVARMLAADHPELVHSVILFAAGGKIPPNPPAEQALKTIFNPAATVANMLEAMKFLVGDPKEIPTAWNLIKPCRAPQAAGIQRTAMENTPLQEWWAPPGQSKYLVVQGSNDQIALPENGELLKQEMGARVSMVSFPGAGHLLVATEPQKAAAAVVSFLHSLPT
jgi:pimeloyl-ACP methyl ester carboxylesterase